MGSNQSNGRGLYNALKPNNGLLRGLGSAFGNGLADSAPLELGNRVPATWGAVFQRAPGETFQQAYRANIAANRAVDAYDSEHHPIARFAGQGVGTVGQLAGLGMAEWPIAAGTRMAQAAKLTLADRAAMASFGAAGGAGGQWLSDRISGRPFDFGDYAGAALGGAVGGAAMPLGLGMAAGAAGGAVTSLTQDGFHRRPLSLDTVERAMSGAVEGGDFGAVAGRVGRGSSNSWTPRTKGQIGEAASQARTLARGQVGSLGPPERFHLENGRYTYPDQRIYRNGEIDGLVESKFGVSKPRLRPRQREARSQLGDQKYRVDHFLPQDVGAALGVLTGAGSSGVGRGLRDRNGR